MMFLAHFTGWGYDEIMQMEIGELRFWIDQAHDLHKQLNTAL